MENKIYENIEVRSYRSDLTSSDSGGRTVTGYAALYNSETIIRTKNGDKYIERIAPGAFRSAILKSDVRALQNHNENFVLGRTKSGTLKIWEDEKGLAFEVVLPESRNDTLESIKRGDVDECSFAFTIDERGATIQRRAGELPIVTVNQVDELFDITIATYPAYKGTTAKVSARSSQLVESILETKPPAATRFDNLLKLAEAPIF